MRSCSLAPRRFLPLYITLALLVLLLQLCRLLVNGCGLLGSETQAVWNWCATESAVLEPSTVEHPLASWTLILHTLSWVNDDYTTSRP